MSPSNIQESVGNLGFEQDSRQYFKNKNNHCHNQTNKEAFKYYIRIDSFWAWFWFIKCLFNVLANKDSRQCNCPEY